MIGSALALIEDRATRAEFVAAGEVNLEYFLGGYNQGYCSEGMGYWTYGFGSYLWLADAVRQSTDGRIDWLQRESTRGIALYPSRLEIFNGIYPCYADSTLGSKPEDWMLDYLERRLQLGRPEWRQAEPTKLPLEHGCGALLFGTATTMFSERGGESAVASPSTAITAVEVGGGPVARRV